MDKKRKRVKPEESKRQKIFAKDILKGDILPKFEMPSNFWEEREKERKLEKENYEKEVKKEANRIENILTCPVCKSRDKKRYLKRDSNGVFGPGHHSTITDDYYICAHCGVHYSDLKKKEIKQPNNYGRI